MMVTFLDEKLLSLLYEEAPKINRPINTGNCTALHLEGRESDRDLDAAFTNGAGNRFVQVKKMLFLILAHLRLITDRCLTEIGQFSSWSGLGVISSDICVLHGVIFFVRGSLFCSCGLRSMRIGKSIRAY